MKMRVAIVALFLCVVWPEGLDAQCPDPQQLKDSNLCARLFEHSSYYYKNSCFGDYLDVYPGGDQPILPYAWNNRISSLVVAPSCSLTVWSQTKKEGKKKKFGAGIQYRLREVDQGLFGNWNDDISGYYCEC